MIRVSWMMVAALAAGCVPVETGELGELSFYDPTSYPDEGLFGGHALDETVAVGAAVEIGVVGAKDGVTLAGVASGAFVVEAEGETVRAVTFELVFDNDPADRRSAESVNETCEALVEAVHANCHGVRQR